ncbi:hypothetical protein QTO34_004915, partial [Cnephaeus nilssonii]
MKCLLLALSVALVCGTQDIFVPQTGESLDIQKAGLGSREWGGLHWPGREGRRAHPGAGVPARPPPRPLVQLTAPPQVAGTWYSVAMAASDLALLSTQSAPLRLYVQELRPTAQGDVEIMAHRWEDSSCVQAKIFAEKTEVPAEFKINSLGDSKVHVLDTDYETFAFLCLENAAPTKQSLACQYLARTPKVDQVVMDQFSRAMKLLPIHIQMAFTPPRQKRGAVSKRVLLTRLL